MGSRSLEDANICCRCRATCRNIAIARMTVSAAQIAAITIVPSLLVCAMAPLQGQHYPISDALVHSFILMVGGLGLFGLTMFLRAITRDVAAYVVMGGLIFLVGLFTFLVQGFTPYSFFRVMNGAGMIFQPPPAVDRPRRERHDRLRAHLAVDSHRRASRFLGSRGPIASKSVVVNEGL